MALSTSSIVNATSVYNDLNRVHRKAAGNPGRAQGVYYIERAKTLATTEIDNADDSAYVFQFPLSCRLLSFACTLTDIDTHATPTHVFNMTVTDGSTPVVLISGSTIGQGGGSDQADVTAKVPGLDVSGLYCMFDTSTAAATPAAGTLTVHALIQVNDFSTETGA